MCELHYDKSASDGNEFYTVTVQNEKGKDYLKIHKLPVDMKYMVHYLRETLSVRLAPDGIIAYVQLKSLKEPQVFKERMIKLEAGKKQKPVNFSRNEIAGV